MTDKQDSHLIDVRVGRDLSVLDLVSIDPLTNDDLTLIYDLAREFRAAKTHKFALNKGCSVVNAFFESSTRTLSSFDLSAKNLSMDTNNVSSSGSISKGESYLDTALTLDAYNLKVLIVRAAEAGVPEFLSRHVKAAVINAGDGWHEHPTQALLDVLTMLDHFNCTDLQGKTLTFVGAVKHYRPFGSLVRLARKMGATIRVAAPKTFIPMGLENFGLSVYHDVEEALSGADIVYVCRVKEEYGADGYIPSLREYSKQYGISRKRMDLTDQGAILMHPGPVRRDIDVHSALVALDEQSKILQQVENGMAVRKALLWLLANRMDGRVKEVTCR